MTDFQRSIIITLLTFGLLGNLFYLNLAITEIEDRQIKMDKKIDRIIQYTD